MELKELNQSLDKYLESYYEKVTTDNAQQVIDEFDPSWESITGYIVDDNSNRQSRYGLALAIFSVATFESSSTREIEVTRLADLINQYDTNASVKYKFGVKSSLFFNLGSCWHKLGALYDNRAVEAYKKYIFYSVVLSSNTSYRPTAYAFRKCTSFLYQSLINEQLNLSSPASFNDPFDCPVRVLLDKGDIYSLIHQAYQECLKIVCFSSNAKLPYYNDELGQTIFNEKKHKRDKAEYLNSLMWGHYADSHKGVCIKYQFCNSISQLGSDDSSVVAFFKDVKYSNKDLSKYSNKGDAITLEDAFFLKGKQWEYENELRFIYYDLNGKGQYGTIDIPGCIEAIYFGLKCSEQDKKTIQNIMRTKNFIRKDLNGTIISSSPIAFYQMELDYKHFGQLKAVRL